MWSTGRVDIAIPVGDSMLRLSVTHDAAEFLDRAGPLLAAEPVRYCIVAGIATLRRSQPADDLPYEPWFATVTADGVPVGVAMHDAPAPYPVWLGPIPPELVAALADLVAADPTVTFVEGAESSVREFAAALARMRGADVEITRRTGLFEFVVPTPPARRPPGRLRPVAPDEVGLCLDWYAQFLADAAEQVGGERGQLAGPDADRMRNRIERGLLYLWECDGEPVHLIGHYPPCFGAARLGPVHTPKPWRGRGFAAAAVYQVSARLRARGVRACLNTNQGNPASNSVYRAVGYRRVGENISVGLVAAAE